MRCGAMRKLRAFKPGLDLLGAGQDALTMAGPQFHRKGRRGSVGAIADTEPDGSARRMILRAQAKRRQETRRAGGGGEISALNPLDFLLAVDDVSRVGALRLANAAWLKARTSW